MGRGKARLSASRGARRTRQVLAAVRSGGRRGVALRTPDRVAPLALAGGPAPSLVDHRQPRRGIAVAFDLDPGQRGFDLGKVGGGQRHVGAAEVFLETLELGRAGDRRDPRLLGEEPGERELLVWTAPGGIDCARMRSLEISDKGDRPWDRLAESGWIRRNIFSSFTG